MIDPVKIGRRIAEERKLRLGLSQEKMVRAMEDKVHVLWNQPDLSNLERGGTGVYNLQKLDTLATFFDVPLQNLIFGGGMETRMDIYYGSKMALTEVDAGEKMDRKHLAFLKTLVGDGFIPDAVRRVVCGSYTVYACGETHAISAISGEGTSPAPYMALSKLRMFVFFENTVIGALWASIPTVFMLANTELLSRLQKMVPCDVLDVTDPARWLNPWLPLAQYAITPSEKAEAERGFQERVCELCGIGDRPVFLIESVYVREECRRKGVFRLLLDSIRLLYGEHLTWLNLEPTDGEELNSGCFNYPEYTQAEIGQFSINAAIAERLGFEIDPDVWHRKLKDDALSGHPVPKDVEVRKCALRMPGYVRDIIGGDGDLVARGRERQKNFHQLTEEFRDFQKMLHEGEPGWKPSASLQAGDASSASQGIVPTDVVDSFTAMCHGAILAEFVIPVGRGEKLYATGVRPRHGDTWFALADRSLIRHGLDIDLIGRFDSPSKTEDDTLRTYFEIAAQIVRRAPDMLKPEKRKEWDAM